MVIHPSYTKLQVIVDNVNIGDEILQNELKQIELNIVNKLINKNYLSSKFKEFID